VSEVGYATNIDLEKNIDSKLKKKKQPNTM